MTRSKGQNVIKSLQKFELAPAWCKQFYKMIFSFWEMNFWKFLSHHAQCLIVYVLDVDCKQIQHVVQQIFFSWNIKLWLNVIRTLSSFVLSSMLRFNYLMCFYAQFNFNLEFMLDIMIWQLELYNWALNFKIMMVESFP